MWDFNVLLLGMTKHAPNDKHEIMGLDVSALDNVVEKTTNLADQLPMFVSQANQLKNPETRIVLSASSASTLLSEFAQTYKGLCSGDGSRFQRMFWEMNSVKDGWSFQQSSIEATRDFAGREGIFYWEEGDGDFYKAVVERLGETGVSAWIRGRPAWGRLGVAVRVMGKLPVTRYTGELYDNNVAVVVAKHPDKLAALWAFCESDDFNVAVRQLNQKVSVTDESFVQVPFDLAHWQNVAAEKYPHGLPKPFSSDPTQWLFDGNVARASRSGSDNNPDRDGLATDGLATLQVAVARLLGYQWPRQTGSSFPDCPALGPDGLERHADQDGIVCIPPVGRESPASDRLLNLLAAAYGEAWSNYTLSQLLAGADHAGNSLETWLRDKFFIQHCKLFHHRPFIWHIWDGLRDGFAALINYHKLDYKALESLIYSYLGDWISRQKQDIANGVDGAQERLAAAEAFKKKLELILEGEAPYDIFVRWKPIEQQPIGWHPDLNDGVRARASCATSPISIGTRTEARTWNLPPGIASSMATASTITT